MPVARAPYCFAAAIGILPSPAAEVEDQIVLGGLHGLEHPGDQSVRRGDPDHVLAGLTGGGLVDLVTVLGLDLGGAGQGEGEGDKRESKT